MLCKFTTIIIIVYIPEPPTVISNSSLITRLVGETVNLSFSVYYGIPEAGNDEVLLTFKRINTGEPLSIGHHNNHQQLSDDNFYYPVTSLSYDDEGLYELTICNRVECASDTIELIVDGKLMKYFFF